MVSESRGRKGADTQIKAMDEPTIERLALRFQPSLFNPANNIRQLNTPLAFAFRLQSSTSPTKMKFTVAISFLFAAAVSAQTCSGSELQVCVGNQIKFCNLAKNNVFDVRYSDVPIIDSERKCGC